jgi:hypothetical protein
VKLQKDTVLSLVKGATVFINYLGACFDSIQGLCPSIPNPSHSFADRPIARSCHVCLPPLSHSIIMLRTHILRGLSDAAFTHYLEYSAHEVSTSKQHKSISASDVFKALELIEFADLIPPLQAELQGTP